MNLTVLFNQRRSHSQCVNVNKKDNKHLIKMDRFVIMESQLIKVEVAENANFHCIVCNAEFVSRIERNEHLETHFIHRNCKDCNRQVIVIGDLEFELHHPIHCKEIESKQEDTFETDDIIYDESSRNSNCKYEYRFEHDASHHRESINFIDSDDEESIGTEHCTIIDQNTTSIQKVKRTSQRRIQSQCNNSMNKPQSHLKTEQSSNNRKIVIDSEDDVVKEMDVAIKKRRKQYTKLPKTVPCTMCDAMFGTERTLKIHMNQVHGIKERYICPICSREFKIGGNLKQHIETHSDYKRFICNFCGKGFHLPYNLKEHMNTHTGARPYKCETCGKTFGRNTLRQAHMRIHTGEKPYKCTEENCDRAYAYQTDLKRHRRSVHGIITKTFPCPICSKVFYENKFLTKHLNIHKGHALYVT